MPVLPRLVLPLALVALAPCVSSPGSWAARADDPRVASMSPPRVAAAEASRVEAQAPARDVPLVVLPRPLVSPLTPAMTTAIREIASRNAELRDDVFAKMGGSSVVNRGFLHCFEEEETIDFRGEPLEDARAFFRAARVGTRSPFSRSSLAAAVGWSLRQVNGGRPPYVLQELRATRARHALVFFGSNDVEGRNAHQFVERLDRTVALIASHGVVPVLGATYPRRANDPQMNEQVRRYNRLSAALAAAKHLPYVDFHQAMLPLPGRGLAADGYHPNTYTVGPRARACDFGAKGLEYGNNQRNLLTLRALDAVRRALRGEASSVSGAAAQVVPPASGAGTAADPVRITALPFSRRFDESELPTSDASHEPCGPRTAGARTFVVRFTLGEPRRLRASAVAMGPLESRMTVRAGDRCVHTLEDEAVVSLEAGTYELEVTVARPRRVPEERAAQPPRLLFALDQEP